MRLKNGKIATFIVNGFLLLSLFSSLILLPPLVYSPYAQANSVSIFMSRWDGSSWTTPIAVYEDITNDNATGDTYQRHCFKDSDGYYYVTFSEEMSPTDMQTRYVSSSDGENWVSASKMHESRRGEDFDYSTNKATVNGTSAWTRDDGEVVYSRDFTVSNGIITMGDVGATLTYTRYTGASAWSNIYNGQNFILFHRNGTGGAEYVRLVRFATTAEDSDTSLEYGNGTSVGCRLLGYNTTDAATADMLAIVKSNDGKLYWSEIDRVTRLFKDTFSSNPLTQLEQGRNDWCATTEAMVAGDPELCHLTFTNSTGLFYNSYFEGWAAMTELGITGASYPVIAVDTDRNLIIMYVRGGEIRYITKPFGSGWGSEQDMEGSIRTVGSPTHLSSNLYEQNGEILLIYTGYTLTYTPPPEPPTNTNFWVTGVLAPYVYVAISVWSLALIIGVGAVLYTQQTDAMPYAVIYGISVTIVLLIALAILAPFLGV